MPPAHLLKFLEAAAPYVRRFRDQIFVVKIGGEALVTPALRRSVCSQIALLQHFGIRVVVVHGGGAQLDDLLARLGIRSEKVAGRRITNAEVLEGAKMVFAGSLQVDLLADLRAAGLKPVGTTGVDGAQLTAVRRPPVSVVPDGADAPRTVDYGLVGDVTAADPTLVNTLLGAGFTPVIGPLTSSEAGEVFNTNADTIAASMAAALNAEKLFFLLGVPGVLRDVSNPATIVSYLTLAELLGLERDGVVTGGMRPKVKAIRDALDRGVRSVHLVSGTTPEALLVEVFTNEGSGTMVVPHDGAA